MKKKCPKCGKEFECKHSGECWCTSIVISKRLSEWLKENYKDCLCKDCLTDYVENQENNLLHK
jgi:hypothetical protein